MSIEDIQERMKVIDSLAETRSLSEEECDQYEALERELKAAQRTAQIRSRQIAYETPVNKIEAPYFNANAHKEDTLERAFDHYLRTGKENQDIVELRAQGEGVGSAGGYLVPPGFRQKIVERMVAYGGLAAEVEQYNTTTGNNVEFVTFDDTANSGSITAENAALTSGADLGFDTVALGAYKYTSAGAGSNLPVRVSVELLQDSAFDVRGVVARALGTRIARAQAAHWCTGTGVGQPKGIVAASLTANETVDASDAIDYDDLLDTELALDPAYEQNAKWVMNKGTWTYLRGIVDSAGRPLIMPQAASGIGQAPARELLGYPVVIDQAMPTHTDTGAYFAVLGDLREAYVIRRVSNLAVFVNPYSQAASGQVEFHAWERADGNIQNRNAYVILRNV